MEIDNYDFATANRLMQQKNYGEVWKYALPHANAGDSNAQCLVALLYQCGLGVAPDLDEAERWLRKAADQNNPLAWNNLGSLYVACIPELKCRWGDVRRCYEKAKELGFNCGEPYPPPFCEILMLDAILRWLKVGRFRSFAHPFPASQRLT